MKQVKPILHGRDHACGGADPIPHYCDLLALLDRPPCCGGDYISRLQAPFSYSPGGTPLPRTVDTWPTIHITGAADRIKYGMQLHAAFSAVVFGDLDFVATNPVVTSVMVALPLPHTIMQTAVSASGMLSGFDWHPGDPEPDDEIDVYMVVEGSYFSEQVAVTAGTLAVTWVGGLDNIPVPPGIPGSPYPGAYPIRNPDVAADAAIDPTKLANPALTTKYLRADGTWQEATIQVEY